MRDPLEIYKKAVMTVVAILLCIIGAFLVVALVYALIISSLDPNGILDIKSAVLEYVGEILLVVIIIELLDTVLIYQKEHIVRVGTVMLVALTAVARELIVFDYTHGDVSILFGISLAVIALSASLYFFSKTTKTVREPGDQKQPD